MDMEQQIVSLTSQNQITLPMQMVKKLGKVRPKNMVVYMTGNNFVVKPVPDFGSLKGSLKSNIVLTDEQLYKAKGEFEKKWARKM